MGILLCVWVKCECLNIPPTSFGRSNWWVSWWWARSCPPIDTNTATKQTNRYDGQTNGKMTWRSYTKKNSKHSNIWHQLMFSSNAKYFVMHYADNVGCYIWIKHFLLPVSILICIAWVLWSQKKIPYPNHILGHSMSQRGDLRLLYSIHSWRREECVLCGVVWAMCKAID